MTVALGVDHGERRIGLAVSDALGLAAHGLPTLERTTFAEDLAAISRVAADHGVGEVVVGLPRNMDGSLGPQAARVRIFAEKLGQALGMPMHLVDERLTTEKADRALRSAGLSRGKRRQRVDRLAAQFILQQFLDMRRAQRREETPGP